MKRIGVLMGSLLLFFTSFSLTAYDPFYGGPQIRAANEDLRTQLALAHQRNIELLQNSPPVTVLSGRRSILYYYFDPYYTYGRYDRGRDYSRQTSTSSVENYVYNAPVYPEAAEYVQAGDEDKDATERIDKYISDLASEDPDVRRIAVLMLIELDAREAESVLIDLMLNDEDASVRKAAAQALGQIGSVKAIEPLYKAKKDEDKDVKIAALISLGNLRKLWVR